MCRPCDVTNSQSRLHSCKPYESATKTQIIKTDGMRGPTVRAMWTINWLLLNWMTTGAMKRMTTLNGKITLKDAATRQEPQWSMAYRCQKLEIVDCT